MTRATNRQSQRMPKTKQFPKFTFIGNCSESEVTNLNEQLHLSANSNLLSQANAEDSLQITQIHTSKDIADRLKSLQVELGTIVKSIGKTRNGSVIVSRDSQLIGISAKIARKIVAVHIR